MISASPEDTPTFPSSHVAEKDGRRYVVLRSEKHLTAIFRIDNTERLRRLKCWPKGGLKAWKHLIHGHREPAAAC